MNLSPLDAVRCYYQALAPGRRADLMDLLDPHVVLEIPEGFPGGGGTYRGLKAYLEDFLYNFYGSFDLETVPTEFLDAGETVIALGHHHGHALSTGLTVDAPFVHIWTVREGLLVRGRMFTDTAALCIAAGLRTAASR
jgi:ketosteroid isomerase-like protein